MLKPKALAKVLEQANTGGTSSTQLLTREGVLVAFSGSPEKNSQVTSAVASSIWDLYEKSGKGVLPGESLDLLILNCEEGRIAIKPVANLLLCVYCDAAIGLGLLKKKVGVVVHHLEEPLSQLVNEES